MAIEITIVMNGQQEILAGLARVKQMIPTGPATMGRRLTEQGERIVEQLTPRRANPTGSHPHRKSRGKPFHAQWDTKENAQPGAYTSVIFNHAAKGGYKTAGHAALGAVERGAKAHPIAPTKAHGWLVWYQGRTARRTATTNRRPRNARSTDDKGNISQITQTFGQRRGSFATQNAVSHPGHGGFYMVRDTRRHMQDFAARIIQQHAAAIGSAFMSPSSIDIT